MEKIALVACVKMKRAEPSLAKDLYISPLFQGMRRHAERHADQWFILSAEHGLLRPESVVAPYEKTLNKMKKGERVEWAKRVCTQMEGQISRDAKIVFLAGERYREGLIPFLISRGNSVEIPFLGMRLGEQLSRLSAN
jgi:hypothetical protein